MLRYKYKTYKAVCHSEGRHDLINADQKDNRCKHLGDDNDSQKDFFTLEFHSCKRISCRDTAYDCNQGRTAGNDQRIDEISGKRCQCPDIFKVLPEPVERK